MVVSFQVTRTWRGVRSQRGGRGKERGFSFGVDVDVDIFVTAVLDIVDSLGCMYDGYGWNGDGVLLDAVVES